jgi:hypothetical protein
MRKVDNKSFNEFGEDSKIKKPSLFQQEGFTR